MTNYPWTDKDQALARAQGWLLYQRRGHRAIVKLAAVAGDRFRDDFDAYCFVKAHESSEFYAKALALHGTPVREG